MAKKKQRSTKSEKKTRQKVDSVANYIDFFSQLITDYIDQRYKIRHKVEEVKLGVLRALFAFKREFMRTIVEAVLILTGILSLIVGVVLLLRKVLPIEYIFLGYGFLITIIVLLQMKTKPQI